MNEGKRRWRVVSKWSGVRIAALLALLALVLLWSWAIMIRMPGESYAGPLPPLDEQARALSEALQRDVHTLAGQIGERNPVRYAELTAAAEFIERSMAEAGHRPRRLDFLAVGKNCRNIELELPGRRRPGEIVVVGAHYDSVAGSPGANDNASGVAALLALARQLGGHRPGRTIRLVAFANEEPPYYRTADMGSLVYARQCRHRGDNIVAMISLETIGYYTDRPNSQSYPPPFNFLYPSTGNFVAFVGNLSSRHLIRQVVGAFRRLARFPSEGGAVPSVVTGVGWSDHWSFWQQGYPALMVTDTAPFRYPYYHSAQDTPERIDYDRLARVVAGLAAVVRELAQ